MQSAHGKRFSASGPAGKIFRGFESVSLYMTTAGGKSLFCTQSPIVLRHVVEEFSVNSIVSHFSLHQSPGK